MPSDLGATVEDHHLGGAQGNPDAPPDQPGGHRILALQDHDPGVTVDPRRQGQTGIEAVRGQLTQQGAFEREVVADGAGPVLDPSGKVGLVGPLERALSSPRVATSGCGTRWLRRNRSTSPSTPPFSCAPSIPGDAGEGVEPGVGAEQRPPVGLGAGPPEQHPGHRAAQVVVADVHRRDPKDPERLQVPLDERLLPLRRVDAVDRRR